MFEQSCLSLAASSHSSENEGATSWKIIEFHINLITPGILCTREGFKNPSHGTMKYSLDIPPNLSINCNIFQDLISVACSTAQQMFLHTMRPFKE